MELFFVTLIIDNGDYFNKWRVIIPENDIEAATEKAKEIYYRDYAGYEDIVEDAKVELITGNFQIIK